MTIREGDAAVFVGDGTDVEIPSAQLEPFTEPLVLGSPVSVRGTGVVAGYVTRVAQPGSPFVRVRTVRVTQPPIPYPVPAPEPPAPPTPTPTPEIIPDEELSLLMDTWEDHVLRDFLRGYGGYVPLDGHELRTLLRNDAVTHTFIELLQEYHIRLAQISAWDYGARYKVPVTPLMGVQIRVQRTTEASYTLPIPDWIPRDGGGDDLLRVMFGRIAGGIEAGGLRVTQDPGYGSGREMLSGIWRLIVTDQTAQPSNRAYLVKALREEGWWPTPDHVRRSMQKRGTELLKAGLKDPTEPLIALLEHPFQPVAFELASVYGSSCMIVHVEPTAWGQYRDPPDEETELPWDYEDQILADS